MNKLRSYGNHVGRYSGQASQVGGQVTCSGTFNNNSHYAYINACLCVNFQARAIIPIEKLRKRAKGASFFCRVRVCGCVSLLLIKACN